MSYVSANSVPPCLSPLLPVHLKSMSNPLFPNATPALSGSGWFTAHCDGGSRGNPGPAGYGAVIEDPQAKVVARLSEYLGRQTNNFAEYSGLLAVLRWALENRAGRLRVVSDSELMVKQMKGIYKVKNPGLIPLWEEAKRLAARLEGFQISHTLRGGNKEADHLANDAMDKGMGRNQGSGFREQGQPAPRSMAPRRYRKGRRHRSLPARSSKAWSRTGSCT